MIAVTIIQPVLAIDIGEVLVGLVALVLVIVRQLLEANKNAGVKRAQQPSPQAPQLQNPNKAPAPAAGQQADPLRAQVEEFLRRAGRPAKKKPPPTHPPPRRHI
jgi:hypothetical protein